MIAWFSNLTEKHKLFRRATLVWAIVLITWVTIRVFTSPPNIGSGTATAYGIVVGLLATAIGFYKWSRYQETKRDE